MITQATKILQLVLINCILSPNMFKKILEQKQTITNEQTKNILQEALQAAKQNPPEIAKQLRQNTEELIPILHDHYELSLDIMLTAMSIQECFHYLKNTIENHNIVSVLYSFEESKVPEKSLKLERLFQRHSSIEKALVIFVLFSRIPSEQIYQDHLPKFIPTFIRIAAYIIEQFLKLKNQPARDSQDHIHADKVVLAHCQEWVSKAISTMLLNVPEMKEENIKKLVLLGICDLIGALLDTLREGAINQVFVLDLLDKHAVPFLFKHYYYGQIRVAFLSELRKAKFENKVTKIIIPDEYDKMAILSTQAFAYITLQYVKKAPISDQEKVRVYACAVGEIISRPYQFKVELVDDFFASLKKIGKITVHSGFQWEYPVGLLGFYLCHEGLSHFQTFNQIINYQDHNVLINSLIYLNQISTQGLVAEKQKFILDQIINQQLFDRRVFTLMKSIKFEGISKENTDLVMKVLKKTRDLYPVQSATLLQDWNKESKINANLLKKMSEQLKL